MTAEFEPVRLLSPDGGVHVAHTPIEVNNLVFGHGYTEVENKGPDRGAMVDTTDPVTIADKKETAGG